MSNDDRPEQTQALRQPKGADPRWQEKIQTSLRAREFAKQMRHGKAASFRRAVGKTR